MSAENPFKLIVKVGADDEGEVVWESDGEHVMVGDLTVSTRNGAFGDLRVANDVDTVVIHINERRPFDNNNPLDIRDVAARNAQAAEIEEKSAEFLDENRGTVEASTTEGEDTVVPGDVASNDNPSMAPVLNT